MEAIRARVKLSTIIGRVVKLHRRGPDWFGLCPFHAETTESFTVNDDKGFYHCFGCQAHGDAIDFLMQNQGLPFGEAKRMLEQDAGLAGLNLQQREADRRLYEQRQAEEARKAADKRRSAGGLFHSAMAGEGTPVQDYLRGRGIDFASLGHWPGALRYRGDVPHGDIKQSFPAMVSCMIGPDLRSIAAVHRTFLEFRPDAQGVPRWQKLRRLDQAASDEKGREVWHKVKMMLGAKRGAHIPVWKGRHDCPLHAIPEGTDIYVSEGIEDAGAVAMFNPELRTIAAGDVGNIGAIAIPEQAGDIIIIAQNDAEGSGGDVSFERAVAKLQEAHRGKRLVKAMWPDRSVKDFAELAEVRMRERG